MLYWMPPFLVGPIITLIVSVIVHKRLAIFVFFTNTLTALIVAKYKIINANEGVRPFKLYRKYLIIWVFQDSYRDFRQAHDDLEAIRNRIPRAFKPTTTYYKGNGQEC